MPVISTPIHKPAHSLTRSDFNTLLLAAMEVKEWRYARRLATAWLAAFPGDIPVKFHFAQAINQDPHLNSPNQALDILDALCIQDPEYLQAQVLLATLRQAEEKESLYTAKGCILALSNSPRQLASKGEMAPIWARQLHEARSALAKHLHGDSSSLEKAEYAIHQALIENPDTPLAAVTHLNVLAAKVELPTQAVLSLAQIYHARWPETLQFSLILADRLISNGDSTQAVEILHQVVAKDITGQVATRMWGKDHHYRSLWPEVIEIHADIPTSPQNIPVPAKVAARLGWNQLPAEATETLILTPPAIPSPEMDTAAMPTHSITEDQARQHVTKSIPAPHRSISKKLSEPIQAVQSEFNRLAKQLDITGLANRDGRFPVYVIFTTRQGLENQYGIQGAALLDDEIKKTVRAIRGQRLNREIWGAILLYADDPEYTSFFGLQPASWKDPWGLKLLLSDVDSALGNGGEKIGAILIVGGSEVVPFHSLPNPVDDADHEVLSDNPYACLGENYFTPEWPIGRLPGSNSSDPTDLVSALRSMTRRYLENQKAKPWYQNLLIRISEFLQRKNKPAQASFGFTAAIWRRASLAVYRIIGNPQDMLVSPPVRSCESEISSPPLDKPNEEDEKPSSCLYMPGTRLAYFNLHGIPDSAFWYGHRDPSEPLPDLEFPVAIRPQDVRNSGSAPQMVFSEACYGAHIVGKGVEEALSLKFLASGSQAVIGSTCISYGSISTPLSAADLLGKIFWGLLEEGFAAGEALRRSKLNLVREMHRRQGYLDPEDQKTIISFVLYGDPLAQPYRQQRRSKNFYRVDDLPKSIHTVSENSQPDTNPAPLSPEIFAQVKNIVAQYLPGMQDATIRTSQIHPKSSNSSPSVNDPSAEISHKIPNLNGRHVISINKNVLQAKHTHSQYARLTMDETGKLLKLTVSR